MGDILSWLIRDGWAEDVSVPKPYARQFRDEAVRVALNCDDGVAIDQTH
jgi:transposase